MEKTANNEIINQLTPLKDASLNGNNPLFRKWITINKDSMPKKVDISTNQCEDKKMTNSLFLVKPANEWMKDANARPIPKMLFSEFWFQGEICILFADTNLGKSILAVQIGNSISKGECIPEFKLEAPKQPVLYYDFELNDKQFENRYSINYEQHYLFDDGFKRVEIDPDADLPEGVSFEDFLITSLEKSIIDTNIKVLIIDNLTYLKDDNERAKDALPLMKQLKRLKSKYCLSIIVLAHTPKRDLSKPIIRNDLQGSKMLINFCDSAFTIGESSTDKDLRYIKQIKCRNTEMIYDTENVIICSIEKISNFLQFNFMNFDRELNHLKQLSKKSIDDLMENILNLKQQGKSFREIGIELGISHMKAKRMFDKN